MSNFLIQAQPAGGGGMSMLFFLLLMFVVMYFFMIRPQRKKEKEMQKLRDGLKKGDTVITNGGIYGEVAEVETEAVIITVESHAKLKISKAAISVINGSSAADKK